MKLFQEREINEAFDYCKEGGQALHLTTPDPHPNIPFCFKRSTRWAHLMDCDRERLVKTAKRLGIRNIKVCRDGRKGQHIDLCGGPLRKALEEVKP